MMPSLPLKASFQQSCVQSSELVVALTHRSALGTNCALRGDMAASRVGEQLVPSASTDVPGMEAVNHEGRIFLDKGLGWCHNSPVQP